MSMVLSFVKIEQQEGIAFFQAIISRSVSEREFFSLNNGLITNNRVTDKVEGYFSVIAMVQRLKNAASR